MTDLSRERAARLEEFRPPPVVPDWAHASDDHVFLEGACTAAGAGARDLRVHRALRIVAPSTYAARAAVELVSDSKQKAVHMKPFEGPAWKQVDASDAHHLERGSLKLGRLEDFQRLENGRADDLDGGYYIDQGDVMLMDEIPEHREAMARMGLGGVGVAVGNIYRQYVKPAYAFCMSLPGCEHDPTPDVPKALFEIADVRALAELLQMRNNTRVREMRFRQVTYERREFNAMERVVAGPDPFIKRPQFSVEQEVRIVLEARPGAAYDTIFTRADEDIAALFTRLR